ncbi:serine/threonine-protein kinase [Mycolicibacterium parafortuitum]|uniref:non-specific serine/threonine protein kinase n=1 Tax=Mycolicibacterium parafortuitum TaxID=39692 RepID=A0A375YMM5_MYCPF|nr:serine/threonine-protein kinase [Mycolicibacterium parafortuitum]ORB28551.1 serine/threonine protein kinase [Mycolicibacterium parafortuitum]SRX82417.1 Anchored-membrane serine/threonine-protein kinase PknF (protein kinase F) (STPK F) [Mycobacterium tuberculosis H37Rv] [Mycolicibacterium parafortuitum]
MPLAAGETFAGYTIVRLLGSGGMGEVYLAQHPRLPRQDALKVLPAEVSGDSEYRQRFEREADIAATLWHPHIVGVHDRGEDNGRIWISMDYVEGTDAAHLLAAQRSAGLPVTQVAEIVTAVADALDYAHENRLLHRDVKPANILLSRPGAPNQRILLADFGIARWEDDISGLTATNMTVGTVSYAAPEQLMGRKLDGRADQYALAATAFHLLTGSPPFSHSNPAVVISQHLSAEPPRLAGHRPELAGLDPVLAKALAKDPADRFEHCADFAHALRHHLTGATAPDSGVTRPATPATEPRSRLRPAIVVPAVLAVLLVVAIAVAALEFLRADRPETPPTAQPTPETTTTPAPAPTVVIGANCAPQGSTATTADGAVAYCTAVPDATATIWSLTHGELPTPTSTPPPDPAEPPLRTEEAFPVLTCMEQTGQTRRECRRAIRESNGLPALP